MSELDLELLHSFSAVRRAGSISGAAQALRRTQPALSMQMRRLESLVGKRLLNRTRRGVTPTPEGEALFAYAERILALTDEAIARVRDSDMTGGVRIGLPEEMVLESLSAALGHFRRVHPGIHLDVTVGSTNVVEPLWRAGKLDIMIATVPVVGSVALDKWMVELRWAAAADYKLDPASPIEIVSFAEPCSWRCKMLDALAAAGRQWRMTFTSSSTAAVQAAIENGLGVSLLTAECFSRERMRYLSLGRAVPDHFKIGYGVFAKPTGAAARNAATRALLDSIRDFRVSGYLSR